MNDSLRHKIALTTLLIIDGLPAGMTANGLKKEFAIYGEVQWARIVTDHYGRSLRFGHVQMDSQQSARAAQRALDGSALMGSHIRVEHAESLGLTFQSSLSIPYEYCPVSTDPFQ